MEVNTSLLSCVTFACAPDNLAEVFSRWERWGTLRESRMWAWYAFPAKERETSNFIN